MAQSPRFARDDTGCGLRCAGMGRSGAVPLHDLGESERELFCGDEGAVAGNAAPDAVAADPGVGVAGAENVFFAFVGAGFAIDAVDDGGVAVDVDGEAFVVEVVGFLIGGGDPLQVFGLVHDRAVVVGVDEGVVDEVGDFFDLLIGFGLIPGAFELADLDFVGAGGFFLREWGGGAEEKCECQEDEAVHFSGGAFVGVLMDVSKEWDGAGG
jgi:hypothetical protein